MNSVIGKNRFLFSRRVLQGLILFLFFSGSAFGWRVLRGDLSGSKVLDAVPLADPFAVLQIFAAGALVSGEALTGAAIVLLFFGVVAGRAFCSWVCPLNIVVDGAAWLRRAMHFSPNGGTVRISRNARYWALGLSIVLSALTGVAAFESVSPISMLQRGVFFSMGAGWAAVLAVFLFDLLVVKNGFCGHICPLGAFYSLISRFSLLRIRYDKDRCNHCMKCVEQCPEQQLLDRVVGKSGFVPSGECTMCGRCIEICGDHAMKFGMRLNARRD